MIELLKLLISLSLSGTLLIFVLLLCKPLYKNRLSRQWQYYIWLIVVARLLLPFTPETSLVGNLFGGGNLDIIQTSTSGPADSQVSPELDYPEHDTSSHKQSDMPAVKHPESDKTLIQNMLDAAVQNIWLICIVAWLMVSVSLLIRKLTIYQSFSKYIHAGCMEVTDMRLWEQLGRLVEQSGVKRTVELYTNSLISSPLLIGFLHPCIILPTVKLSDSDFKNTILHELMHYKRRDIFYKWLVQITVCLHWFNPFVYIMAREINRACELSCDEAVIKGFDKDAQRAYGDTLLNAIGAGGPHNDSFVSVMLNENAELLKERLDAIMKFKKPTRLTAVISIALMIALCSGATAVGAYAADSSAPLKGEEVTPEPQSDMIPPKTANTEQEDAPLRMDNSKIAFEDNQYHWPYNAVRFTNTSDKAIIDYEIVCLAYDKNGNPLELYWDAQNVAADGEIGSVGFGTDGVDYGIVTGISPVSPKAYSHIYRKMRQLPPEDLIRSLEKENGKAWVENWLQEWKKSEEELARENAVAPGQSQQISWPLFDGWNQSMGTHDVTYLVAFIKQVTYDDGNVWENPAYGIWVNEYQGKPVSTSILEDYYD